MSSKKSKISIILLTLVISIIVILGTSESSSYNRVHNGLEFYTVKEGASYNSILKNFSLHPLQEVMLKIYIRVNGINVAQAGHYYIKNQSWKNFISSVNNGDVAIFKLQIPEGKNLFEIKRILSESNSSKMQETQMYAAMHKWRSAEQARCSIMCSGSLSKSLCIVRYSALRCTLYSVLII